MRVSRKGRSPRSQCHWRMEGALLDQGEDHVEMPLGVEVLLGVHHLALEGEAGSHQGDHGGPWDQGALLEGSQAYRPEASVLVRDIQERVLAMVDHGVGHVVVNPLVCLLVDHLGCSAWSLVSLAYRFLSASGLASTSSCCSDCSVVFPHLELYLHYRWHVRLHSPSNAGPRHLRRHQPRGHRQICPRNPTHAQISADLLSSDVLQTYHRLEWMSGWGCVQRLAIAADGSCLSGPRAGPCCGEREYFEGRRKTDRGGEDEVDVVVHLLAGLADELCFSRSSMA